MMPQNRKKASRPPPHYFVIMRIFCSRFTCLSGGRDGDLLVISQAADFRYSRAITDEYDNEGRGEDKWQFGSLYNFNEGGKVSFDDQLGAYNIRHLVIHIESRSNVGEVDDDVGLLDDRYLQKDWIEFCH